MFNPLIFQMRKLQSWRKMRSLHTVQACRSLNWCLLWVWVLLSNACGFYKNPHIWVNTLLSVWHQGSIWCSLTSRCPLLWKHKLMLCLLWNTVSQQRKGLTIVYTAINTYTSSGWYIPFIFTLMAVFFAGLVSWVCFLFWRYGNAMECCQKTAKEVSKPKPKYVIFLFKLLTM